MKYTLLIYQGSTPKSSGDPIRPRASSFCPNVGSSSVQLRGSTAAVVSPRILKISTATHWLFSASLQSASCFESFAILDILLGRTLSKSPALQPKLVGMANALHPDRRV